METTLSTGSIIGIALLLFLFLLQVGIVVGKLIKRSRQKNNADYIKRIDDDYHNHLFL